MSPLKLDRRARALCRKLFQHGWKRDRLAEELQCSQTTIKRVLDREENKYHDDFSDGLDHKFIDAETWLKYDLGPYTQPSSSLVVDRRIAATPHPELHPNAKKARALSANQRALVRQLACHIRPLSKLSAHFRVSYNVLHGVIINQYNPPDDVAQDSLLAPAAEVRRHMEMIGGSRVPSGPLSSSTGITSDQPQRHIGNTRRPLLLHISGAHNSDLSASTRTSAQRTSAHGTATILNSVSASAEPVLGRDLSRLLVDQSLEHLTEVLLEVGITDLSRLRQACLLDTPGELVTHDFWRLLQDRGKLTTLDFYLLRQIALSK